MQTITPEFMEWVTVTIDGWILSKDAPDDVRREFDEYILIFKPIKQEGLS